MQDDIGVLKRMKGMYCEKARVTGAGASKPYSAANKRGER